MTISIVAAVARNGVIGKGNALPWRLPGDLARFKSLTMGHALIVGRRTFDSIGRPLPGRRMIVVTRHPEPAPEGVLIAPSFERALELAGEGEVFVAGGAAIYRLALPRADRIYLTEVDADVDGDVRFPELDRAAWTVVSEEPWRRGPKDEHRHRLRVLESAR